MIPQALSNISSTVLNALGMEAKSFVNYIIGAIALVVIILTTTQFVGIVSLILGTGACMTISSALNIRLINKKLQIKTYIMKKISVMVLLAVPSLLFTVFTFNIFNSFCPKFFALAFGSISGALCFIILCMIFKVIDIKSMLTEFSKPKKAKELPQTHIQSSN